MTPPGELPLDNETLVRWEFASEERLEQRNAIFRALTQGDDAEVPVRTHDTVFVAEKDG